MNGLTKEVSVLVTVDEAPTVTDRGESFDGKTYDVKGTFIITNVSVEGWFEDPEGAGLTLTAASEDVTVASVTDDGTAVIITGHTIDHTTKITVMAAETAGLGQTAKVEFMVRVTEVTATN